MQSCGIWVFQKLNWKSVKKIIKSTRYIVEFQCYFGCKFSHSKLYDFYYTLGNIKYNLKCRLVNNKLTFQIK